MKSLQRWWKKRGRDPRNKWELLVAKVLNTWNTRKVEKKIEKILLGFSDQQLMTGIGMLVVAFAGLPNGAISIYHFQLAVDTAWFSANTHLITLTALRRYFRENSRIAICRVALICALGCLLISATCLLGNIDWNPRSRQYWNCPAAVLPHCFKFNWILLLPFPDISNSLSILVFGYASNLIPLSQTLDFYVTKLLDTILEAGTLASPFFTHRTWSGYTLQFVRVVFWPVTFALRHTTLTAVAFHVYWFALGLLQLFSDRTSGEAIMIDSGNENELAFGQVLALFLLGMNLLSAFEIFEGIRSRFFTASI